MDKSVELNAFGHPIDVDGPAYRDSVKKNEPWRKNVEAAVEGALLAETAARRADLPETEIQQAKAVAIGTLAANAAKERREI